MAISINAYQGHYSTNQCNFFAADNELLVVAEYWEDSTKHSDSLPLQGFGRGSCFDFLKVAEEAISQAMIEQYGEEVEKTGKQLLVLVMKYTLY